jgi:lipoprotein-releasing system ATP-binding protein
LRVSGLSVSFSSGVKKKPILLLNNASFSVSICQVVGILGLSSSGKTSILNALGGLYGSGGYRLSGSIQYPLKFFNPLPRHCFIWVDESFEPNITVEEYLKSIFAFSLIPESARELRFHMELLLDIFELKHLRHCIICSSGNKPLLSLYDRKRISLCRAFIQRPSMLLIDEITSGLSEEESDTMFNLIKNYNASRMNFLNNEQITILTLHQPSQKVLYAKGINIHWFLVFVRFYFKDKKLCL